MLPNRTILALALPLLLAPVGVLAAQKPAPDPGRLTTARNVLTANGSIETMVAAMKAAIPAQKMANPQIPAEFWNRFENRIMSDVPQLVDSIAVLYAQKFTQAELDAMLAFFRSPVGQRLKTLQPSLVTESSAIGQRWGMRIGAEIGASLVEQPPQQR